jgi:hypothetical protein
MVIIHHCLFAAQPGSLPNFCMAANSFMAAPAGTLMNDVKEAFQGSASVMKGDSNKVFYILKNVLGELLLLLCISDRTYWTTCDHCSSCH